MLCNNAIVADTLSSSLESFSLKLNKVGITWSINTFELEMRNWVTAFFEYSNLKMPSPFDDRQDDILDHVQVIFDILQDEIGDGILIPRVRNHLQLALLNLEVKFQDILDFDRGECSFEHCDQLESCMEQIVGSQVPGSEWVASWVKKNLDS